MTKSCGYAAGVVTATSASCRPTTGRTRSTTRAKGDSATTVATAARDLALGGVMHYVELDVNNLRRWFTGCDRRARGNLARTQRQRLHRVLLRSPEQQNAERRAMRAGIAAPCETGEYGFEDIVNPADANGAAQRRARQAGEDV